MLINLVISKQVQNYVVHIPIEATKTKKNT
jgi:hypothetical protein